MGTSAFILTQRSSYSPEKLLSDVIVAVFRTDLTLSFDNDKHYSEEGVFQYVTMTIMERSPQENKAYFIFYIKGKERPNIQFDDNKVTGLCSSLELNRAGVLEELHDAEEVVFHFVYEYLKMNPEDYFWAGDDWVFNWEDMQKLKELPFDPSWCYKRPSRLL